MHILIGIGCSIGYLLIGYIIFRLVYIREIKEGFDDLDGKKNTTILICLFWPAIIAVVIAIVSFYFLIYECIIQPAKKLKIW